jgi:putative Mg2+ transporter-C (MgtC) family protein
MGAELGGTSQLAQLFLRLIVATLLGALVGFERERAGKAAGLRTHMLVSLATTVCVLGSAGAGFTSEGMSRVVQGIVTGIGFLGAGTILQRKDEIHGLTTAAGIWMTAAIGIAVGLGNLAVAVMGTLFALIVLALSPLEIGSRD